MDLFDAKEGRVGQVIPMPVVALYAVYNRLTHSLESCNRNIIQIKQNRKIYWSKIKIVEFLLTSKFSVTGCPG